MTSSVDTQHDSPRIGAGRAAALGARGVPYLLFVPGGLAILAVSAYPVIYALSVSTLRYQGAMTTRVGLDNYRHLLSDSQFWSALKTTCVYAGVATAIELVLGLLLALALADSAGRRRYIRTVFIVPMVVAPIVVGITWKLLYASGFGAIPYLLSLVGIQNVGILDQPGTALWALIVVDVWEWTPFMFLVILAGLQSLPQEPLEAAEVDGARSWRIFWTIRLPLMRPVIAVALLIRLIDSFTTFDQIFVITRGGPGISTQLISIYAYNTGFKFSQFGYASSMLVVAMTILVSIAALVMLFVRRENRRQAL